MHTYLTNKTLNPRLDESLTIAPLNQIRRDEQRSQEKSNARGVMGFGPNNLDAHSPNNGSGTCKSGKVQPAMKYEGIEDEGHQVRQIRYEAGNGGNQAQT